MDKLKALVAALKDAKVGNPEAIEAFADEGTLEQSGNIAGPDLLLFRHRYTGVIELDGVRGSLEVVLGQVVAWLEANGGDEDAFEGWTGSPVDRKRADLELRVNFEEEVRYVPAEVGYAGHDKITWQGAEWKLGALAETTATTLEPSEGGITASRE